MPVDSSRFDALLEAIASDPDQLDEMVTPAGMRKGIAGQLKWLQDDVREAAGALLKVQPDKASMESLNVVYNSMLAVRSLVSEVSGVLSAMDKDPQMSGVASQRNLIHLRKQVKKLGTRWVD